MQHDDLLTERELEILECFQAGKSNREIAEALFISINTVKYHGKNINLKLEVDSRQAAIEKPKRF